MVDTSNDQVSDFAIFSTLLKYCVYITIVPITTFFLVKIFLFDGVLGLETVSSNVYSAVVAVVVLHVTLGLYIYRAYAEAEKAPKPVKAD